jgi:hypothetical protein
VLTRDTPTPATVTDAATLTTAGMIGGIITGTQSSGSTNAITLPTGTVMSAALEVANDVGQPIIESVHASALSLASGTFRCRKTAPNTWVAYRI